MVPDPSPEAWVPIHGVASSGAGVGRMPDGRVVFVHRTAPGDQIRLAITETRPRWLRGRLLQVMEAGSGRVSAPCPYFSRCGGCTLQHLSAPAQEDARVGWVREALSRIGKLDPLPDLTFHATPHALGYRNRATFTLRRLGIGPRGGATRVVAGFHAIDRPGHLVDVGGSTGAEAGCLLLEPALQELWSRVREGWGPNAAALPAGESLRLTLRVTEAREGLLLIEGGHGPGKPEVLLTRVPGLAAIWHRPGNDGPPRLLAGSDTLEERWMGESFPIRPGAFLQVNREGARVLHGLVLAALDAQPKDTVVDAYCGMGFYGRAIARLGAQVIGLELDAEAVAMGEARPVPRLLLEAGAVEALLAKHLPADRVILNPPRGGIEVQVVEALLKAPPRRLVYVSCDPATLARDLGRLAPAFRIRQIQLVDLFPQTAHVETVVTLDALDA